MGSVGDARRKIDATVRGSRTAILDRLGLCFTDEPIDQEHRNQVAETDFYLRNNYEAFRQTLVGCFERLF